MGCGIWCRIRGAEYGLHRSELGVRDLLLGFIRYRWGVGCRVWRARYGGQGVGCRVWGAGCGVWDVGQRLEL